MSAACEKTLAEIRIWWVGLNYSTNCCYVPQLGAIGQMHPLINKYVLKYKVPLRDVGGMKSGGRRKLLAPLFLMKMISE